MGPKKGKSKDKGGTKEETKAPAGSVPAPSLNLSSDLADLVNKKIREFEKSSAEEVEKSEKAQRSRARTAAKTKLKEIKQIISGTSPDAEKVQVLWERMDAEQNDAAILEEDAESKMKDLTEMEELAENAHNELSKSLSTKSKLESLFRQLQQQTATLNEERRQMTDAERQRRQDLADEFQQTISEVKNKMDQQASERSRLALENEVLRARFKEFFEKYDAREKDLAEQQKTREGDLKAFEQKLGDAAHAYRFEAERERKAEIENDQLTSAEQALRQQLQTYGAKFQHFQDALSKSDKVLAQYKRQKGKMQRRAEVLEKENAELRLRNERKEAQLLKDREALVKDKASMQERCKALQAERQQLSERTNVANTATAGHRNGNA